MLSNNPHGGEHLKDLLAGQILWVGVTQLIPVAAVSTLILAIWFGLRQRIGRIGFYLLFAIAVTASVQLVGVYLVFSTLIMPALAVRDWQLICCAGQGKGALSLGNLKHVARNQNDKNGELRQTRTRS